MSALAFDCSYSEEGVTLTLRPDKLGLLDSLLRRRRARDLEHLSADDRDLMMALADLRALGDALRGPWTSRPIRSACRMHWPRPWTGRPPSDLVCQHWWT